MQIICINSHFRLAKPHFLCILRVPASYPWLTGTELKKLTTDKKVMKTIAILALTAAALVSCQQQQQQQVVPTVEPAVVAPIKK